MMLIIIDSCILSVIIQFNQFNQFIKKKKKILLFKIFVVNSNINNVNINNIIILQISYIIHIQFTELYMSHVCIIILKTN
jgi:hypothetical protein